MKRRRRSRLDFLREHYKQQTQTDDEKQENTNSPLDNSLKTDNTDLFDDLRKIDLSDNQRDDSPPEDPPLIECSNIDVLSDFSAVRRSRPAAVVHVASRSVQEILDGGAHFSYINEKLLDRLPKGSYTVERCTHRARVSNSEIQTIHKQIKVVLSIRGVRRQARLFAMKNCSSPLILGTDALHSFNITIRHGKGVWHFDNSEDMNEFEQECMERERKLVACDAIAALEDSERQELDDSLTNVVEKLPQDLGMTTLAEHKIKLVRGTKPIKQRNYPLSPIKLEALRKETIQMKKMEWSKDAKVLGIRPRS